MKPNKLRELINEGKPTMGFHSTIPWPRIVEMVGHAGGTFDYMEYIGEYSTFTIEQFENFGRAIELFPNMSSMIKVEEQTRGFIVPDFRIFPWKRLTRQTARPRQSARQS